MKDDNEEERNRATDWSCILTFISTEAPQENCVLDRKYDDDYHWW